MARLLPCSGLLWVVLLSAGCSDENGGSSKGNPPLVSLAVNFNPYAGVRLPLTVSVTGCETVAELGIYDVRFEPKLLKQVTYEGPSTAVALERNEIPYATHGIAAELSLIARARCDDGRSNDSNAAPAKFLPVERATEMPNLPRLFYAEGSGDNTTFVGCRTSSAGVTELVRVNQVGEVVKSNNALPFGCIEGATFTDLNVASGTRWMVVEGIGAVAFNQALEVTNVIHDHIKHFAVGPDGDAVYWNPKKELVTRISHDLGDTANNWQALSRGLVNGTPVVNPSFGIFVPIFLTDIGLNEGIIAIQTFDYADGTSTAVYEIRRDRWGLLDTPAAPPVTFNVDGTVLFVPFVVQPGVSGVLACASNENFCSGSSLKWQTVGLTGTVLATVPYGNNSLVAVLAAQHAWFLDMATGQLVNKDEAPVVPQGALVTQAVQPGTGRDFYLLNGANAEGASTVELVGLDSPDKGELLRYEILSGSLTIAIDDSGAAWLRIGQRLVKPLPLSEYRKVRASTP